jgi:beta-aspartyl-peptidase (threonine type)
MEKSRHVMLMGDGADAFAASQGLEQVAPSFFFTEPRWRDLLQQLEGEGLPSPARPDGAPPPPGEPKARQGDAAHEFGTVGVVALDLNGNLAAGTSTGGTGVKLPGRVGDSPIIGAGTYASNSSCAVSSTGVGEFFIRLTIAREICALVEYRGLGLQQAADEVIQKRLASIGGSGGVIAVQPDGQTAWSFNTTSMLRARQSQGEQPEVHIYGDEP